MPIFTVTHDYSSFLQYATPKGVSNQLDLRLEIKLSDHVRARNSSLLFYVGLHDYLSVGSDGDYFALGILNNHVVLQYNLGSGAANITSQQELRLDKEWYTILAGRKGRDGYLYIDRDDMQEGQSPPPLVGLNVFGHMYLGGIRDTSQLNSEVVFKEGFMGTIKDPKIRTGSSNSWVSMVMTHSSNNSDDLVVVMGLNIQNERVNACVQGACLNNGSCESLGASYVCQCLPTWSGMMCNDTAIPCREYNPCQGRSTCRTRDLGFTCDCPLGKTGKHCENSMLRLIAFLFVISLFSYCLCVCVFVYFCICLLGLVKFCCLCACLFVCLFVYLRVCLFVCVFVYLGVCSFVPFHALF